VPDAVHTVVFCELLDLACSSRSNPEHESFKAMSGCRAHPTPPKPCKPPAQSCSRDEC
jgi:hypothetical protein